MNKNSKIYVAGHQGLVGSAIWKSFRDKGYTNLIGKSYEELDLMESGSVKDFFDAEQPEYVILAAAYVGGINANDTYRADFIYRNLQIQNNIIGESFRHNVKKLLFLGGTCIYPRNSVQPITEDCLLTSPLEYTNEPYAIAKIAGLKMCESFNIQYGTNYIAVMPPSIYGPNDNFDLKRSHVLPALIRKMHLSKCLHEHNWTAIQKDIKRRPLNNINSKSTMDSFISTLNEYGIYCSYLNFWGTGKPLREFLWSEDMGDASVFIMENIDFNDLIKGKEEIRNCHINVGTGTDISIKNLAKIVAETVGYTGKIKFDRVSPDGTMRKLTDISKLNSLGWRHKVELEEGVEKLYKWYLADQEIKQ